MTNDRLTPQQAADEDKRAEPRTDLWINKNKVWGDDESEKGYHQVSKSEYPLRFWLCCHDCRDGDGWGRTEVLQHVSVEKSFLWDVKQSAELYGVLVTADSEEAVVALSKAGYDPLDLVPTAL